MAGGTATLTGNAAITGNTSLDTYWGVGVLLLGASLTVTENAAITGNRADCFGGIFADSYGESLSTVTGVTTANCSGNTGTSSECPCENLGVALDDQASDPADYSCPVG